MNPARETKMPARNETLRFTVTVGEPFVIELKSIPGAGILWSLHAPVAACEVTALESVPEASGVGGPSLQRFRIRCSAAGVHHLRFEMKRPWEPTIRATQDAEISVKPR